MTSITANTFQNPFLPIGATNVDAILSVRSAGSGSNGSWRAPRQTAVVIIVDKSGSMASPRSKLLEARRAAMAAIDCLREGVLFGVIAGSDRARRLGPWETLVPATEATRETAKRLIRSLGASGGTEMSKWLLAAHALLAPRDGAIRRAILLTDGMNGEERATLDAALQQCEGVFQCDCRGVGTDWSVGELRAIATALLGTVDIVAEPEGMAADFESIVRATMEQHLADVTLRVALPREATVSTIKQVAPELVDLTDRAVRVDDRTFDYSTGAWGDEEREYHVRITVQPGDVGDEMRAARISVVVGGETAATSAIRATWTDDLVSSTVIHPRVAHAIGQEDLAAAIAEGMSALRSGDDTTASRAFGEAVRLAAESGHDETMRLLARVVDIRDAGSGTVTLKPRVSVADEMALDTRSTRTVRVRPTA